MIEAVCVVGMEGSGTQWLTHALLGHPEIERTLHQSYPVTWAGSPYQPLGQYGAWNGCESVKDCTAPVIVMMRDQTCSAESNERRGFFRVDPSRRNRDRARREMWSDIHQWRGPVLPVSYEGLVEHAEEYLSYILIWLGVDPTTYDWASFDPYDANVKHILQTA